MPSLLPMKVTTVIWSPCLKLGQLLRIDDVSALTVETSAAFLTNMESFAVVPLIVGMMDVSEPCAIWTGMQMAVPFWRSSLVM